MANDEELTEWWQLVSTQPQCLTAGRQAALFSNLPRILKTYQFPVVAITAVHTKNYITCTLLLLCQDRPAKYGSRTAQQQQKPFVLGLQIVLHDTGTEMQNTILLLFVVAPRSLLYCIFFPSSHTHKIIHRRRRVAAVHNAGQLPYITSYTHGSNSSRSHIAAQSLPHRQCVEPEPRCMQEYKRPNTKKKNKIL